jgi:hypothetical protein
MSPVAVYARAICRYASAPMGIDACLLTKRLKAEFYRIACESLAFAVCEQRSFRCAGATRPLLLDVTLQDHAEIRTDGHGTAFEELRLANGKDMGMGVVVG